MPGLLLIALLVTACSSLPQEAPTLLRGRLVLETIPNPLLARPLGDDLYEMAFDIVMREEGGVDTRIEQFTVEAIALGGVVVRSETHPASFITSRGYPAEVKAGKLLQFHFVKQWTLPTDLLLSGAAVRVTARTIDANGRRDVTTFRARVDRWREPGASTGGGVDWRRLGGRSSGGEEAGLGLGPGLESRWSTSTGIIESRHAVPNVPKRAIASLFSGPEPEPAPAPEPGR